MNGTVTNAVIVFLILMNLIAFFAYGIDKRRAIRHRWRIPESALLGFAFCFGGAGAFLGMRIFRHKTRHKKFIVLVPMALVVQILVILCIFV